VRALVAVFACPRVVELLVDRTDQLDWNHVEAIGEEEQLLLRGRPAQQEPLQFVEVLLLDAVALSFLDWKSIAIEIVC
jgi:hypothetical protein